MSTFYQETSAASKARAEANGFKAKKKWPGPKPVASDTKAASKKVSDDVWIAKRVAFDRECFAMTMTAVREYEADAMRAWKAGEL